MCLLGDEVIAIVTWLLALKLMLGVIVTSAVNRARFLFLARSKLRLCPVNHRTGYWSNLPCDWPSTAWAHAKQETENGPRPWLSLPSRFLLGHNCVYRRDRLSQWYIQLHLWVLSVYLKKSACYKSYHWRLIIFLGDIYSQSVCRACFLSLAWSGLGLRSANHRAGYLPSDWLSIAWAHSA